MCWEHIFISPSKPPSPPSLSTQPQGFWCDCRAALRVKVHLRKGQLGRTIQQTWVLLQDLHQLSAVQGGKNGRARARRMESLMKVGCALVTSHHILHNHITS